MITLCENCAHVEPVSKRGHPAGWLCTQHRRLDGHGFVSHSYWADKEPLLRCKDTNGGCCPLYRAVPNSKLAHSQSQGK